MDLEKAGGEENGWRRVNPVREESRGSALVHVSRMGPDKETSQCNFR